MLAIVYRGGRGTYLYADVSAEEWEAFRTSPSKGTYLNEIFKLKDHSYEKADERIALPREPELVWAR